ncbi:MAG: phenylalanine--tRNA ligase subunit beta [Planctomycetales bacterium]|nr:phenylalanine--tRNA ligase subunit beta [Planctomycetales bacterium]
MLVSWNWLKEYVDLAGLKPEEVANRLMLAGLNLESIKDAGSDVCIDLEITSNRPDCLGHIGVAREIAVLFEKPLKLPTPSPESPAPSPAPFPVRVDSTDLCPRYTARVIRGIKVKSSPAWMVQRLAAIGQPAINNIVDITNYVLMECGQPLHAFDLKKLLGQQIIVRRAKKNEPFIAIDHKTYALDEHMCVIADAQRPVALGGVMGGAETEIIPSTVDVLIESAQFAPLAIRTTSRALRLSSDSSYRFERGTDPEGVDWASRRCCQLILELAGGTLVEGVTDVGQKPVPREPVVLRLAQVERILGIKIPAERVRQILTALGCRQSSADSQQIKTIPPSWRRDLTREIDLIEESARIHGYDAIPEDAAVPMTSSHRTDADRVLARARQVLTAAGFNEAMTRSVVSEECSAAFSPWSAAEPLVANTPMVKGEDRIRRSLVPSLLGARKHNESVGNASAELFETARIYLPQGAGLPSEQSTLTAVSGEGFLHLKGVVEILLSAINPNLKLEVRDYQPANSDCSPAIEVSELQLAGKRLGFLGNVTPAGLKQFGLRKETAILEIDLGSLVPLAVLIPKFSPVSAFPTISRDLNLIVDEPLRWSELESVVRASAGEFLDAAEYLDTYRDTAKDGPGKKRLLFSLTLRAQSRTLTSEEADQTRDAVVAACAAKFGAKLLG